MSRNKKSRSLKRVTGGVKTGSKERTKLENKQNKARKKANTMTGKTQRQRSVYQKALDENKAETSDTSVNKAKTSKPSPQEDPCKATESLPETAQTSTKESIEEPENTPPSEDDLWDQLENPNSTDTF